MQDNCGHDNGGGVVIGTEYEPGKVDATRRAVEEAGLSALVDLREGDLSVDVGGDVEVSLLV